MLTQELTAKSTIEIDAPITKVWEALTDPKSIKKYFFGTETISDWKVGSAITFKGMWDGKEYEDKGIILNFEPNKLLRFRYWSPMSEAPDIPENYANITYKLSRKNNRTLVKIIQDNIATEEKKKQSELNWQTVLTNLKKLLEN